jgi:CHASE2 domain-containing sensor protein
MPTAWLVAKTRDLVSQLKKKSLAYWVRLLMTVIIVQSLVTWADGKGWITGYRYSFHRFLQNTSPKRAVDRDTVVVTIGDDEYWKGSLQGRVPIKRDYLARVIEALDVAEAKVIALDFDLRSPTPDGKPVESPDYADETKKFLETVRRVAPRRAVVLPRTIWKNGGEYITNADIYNGYDFGSPNVFEGYIALPYDRLKIPLTLKLREGMPLDSFSMAIVRAFRPRALDDLPQAIDALYGSFINEKDFDRKTAHEVLDADPNVLREYLGGRVVIVGGAWSKWAYGIGQRIDIHETPMGSMPGAYLHANYVEAILGMRTYAPFGERVVKVIEWLVIAGMTFGFAAFDDQVRKVGIVVISWILLGLFSYFSFINLGIIFDLFVPALSVTVHWFFEYWWEMLQSKKTKA